jgi:hypothetical protein
MTEYIIENVWQLENSDTRKEVVDFWLAEGVIPTGENAQERAKQLVLVARDPEGKIAGVCTAYIKYYPKLVNNFYYYRSFTSKEYRHQGLSRILIKNTREFFNNLFQEGKEPGVIGMYLEVENELLKQIKKTIWFEKHEKFIFIGTDQFGSHHRISYFDNARIS